MLDARNDARNEGGAYQRVEVITGRQRRRRWTAEEKARIVRRALRRTQIYRTWRGVTVERWRGP
jgi:transposase-like protein